MNYNELRLQRLNVLLSNVKEYDNKEYIEKLELERQHLINHLLHCTYNDIVY